MTRLLARDATQAGPDIMQPFQISGRRYIAGSLVQVCFPLSFDLRTKETF
jgi:hypothetical protein